MWFITISLAAIIATLLYFLLPKKYQLQSLTLMLWGATVMILVDHTLGYTGGKFLAPEVGSSWGNELSLGLLMLLPVIIIWLVILFRNKK
jgi:hypothetical protein